jgi:hypothetical protein
MDDASDSMGKIRNADYVVTLNGRDDNAQIEFFIAKNRLGVGRRTVGPLPTDFGVARISPVSTPWVVPA